MRRGDPSVRNTLNPWVADCIDPDTELKNVPPLGMIVGGPYGELRPRAYTKVQGCAPFQAASRKTVLNGSYR